MTKKKILVLGGTQFIGRDFVESIKPEQFEITLFNRGKTNSDLFPHMRKITGDRNTEEIFKTCNESWDVIIDFSCYFPNPLEDFVKEIKSKVGKYIFISSVSVYPFQFLNGELIDENTVMLEYEDSDKTDTSGLSYGKRKVACEDVLKESGMDTIILRPGLVYGNYDPTDRLYYWLYRLKKRDGLLLPSDGSDIFTFSYVKDLTQAILGSITADKPGYHDYNAVSDARPFIEFLKLAKELLGSNTKFHSADAEFLRQHEMVPGKDFPLWFNTDVNIDNSKIKKELDFEPISLKNAFIQTIAFYEKQNWLKPSYGISLSAEDTLMEALHEAKS